MVASELMRDSAQRLYGERRGKRRDAGPGHGALLCLQRSQSTMGLEAALMTILPAALAMTVGSHLLSLVSMRRKTASCDSMRLRNRWKSLSTLSSSSGRIAWPAIGTERLTPLASMPG
ncbi:hypothetical protein KC345_g142 [Hortaea werneckii]|nr:hypothetical protein KC345_g142 [Hortaea werneckii]